MGCSFCVASAPRNAQLSIAGMAGLHDSRPGTVADVLRNFGYEYQDGRLIELATSEGFVFKNQGHYDQLAELVLLYVGELLVTDAGLLRVMLPLDAEDGEPQVPVFVSPGFDAAEK